MQVIPSLDMGGAERTTIEMTEAIIAAGWRAIVVTQGGRLEEEIVKAGGELILLPVKSKNPLTLWRNSIRIRRLMQKHNVSLVHARSRAPAWSCYWAARALNVPFITTYHGAYGAQSRLKRWYNSSMVRGTRIIANSEFTKNLILQAHGETEPDLATRITVVFRGADMKRFSPPNKLGKKAIDQGLSHNFQMNNALTITQTTPKPFRLLLPARMTAWKGHEIVIKSLLILSRAGQWPNLRIVFLGGAHTLMGEDVAKDWFRDQEPEGVGALLHATPKMDEKMGPYEAHLRELVVKNGVSDLVHFVAHNNNIASALAWADGVLVPSTRPEAFGRVVVEAGAMAKPVIASNHGGARETIIDQKTGFLVTPNDAQALADAIHNLMEMDEEKRQKIGHAARDRVLNNFTTKTMCDQTIAIYKDVIKQYEAGRISRHV